MGSALLKGWIAKAIAPVIVVEPRPSRELRKIARSSKAVTCVADIARVPLKRFRACVVALKPQILKHEAPALRAIAESGSTMISIAAGTSTKSLRKAWGAQARVVRAMPNTPGAIGRGVTGLYAAKNAAGNDRRLAGQLLSALGETLWVKTGGRDRRGHRTFGLRARLPVPAGRSARRRGRSARPCRAQLRPRSSRARRSRAPARCSTPTIHPEPARCARP